MSVVATTVVETISKGKPTDTTVSTISLLTQPPSSTTGAAQTGSAGSAQTTTSAAANGGWGGGPPNRSDGPPPFIRSILESVFAQSSSSTATSSGPITTSLGSPASNFTSKSTIAHSSSGISGGAIAGIVLGTVAVLLLALGLILLVLQRRSSDRKNSRNRGGDGSLERTLDPSGSDDVEGQNAPGHEQGILSRIGGWLMPWSRSRTTPPSGAATAAQRPQKAELGYNPAAKELHGQAKVLEELPDSRAGHNAALGTTTTTTAAVAGARVNHANAGAVAELMGEGHHHEVENSELPFRSAPMKGPVDWSDYKVAAATTLLSSSQQPAASSTTDDSETTMVIREHELHATSPEVSMQTRLLTQQQQKQQPAERFPYPGLIMDRS